MKKNTIHLSAVIFSLLSVSLWAAPFADFEFVEIPAGTYYRGSPASEAGRFPNEGPRRQVRVRSAFEMQTTPLTQRQWVGLMHHNPSNIKEYVYCPATWTEVNGQKMCPENPVDRVSWDEVQDFLGRLNQATSGYHYRLPTEIEWEYAARAGSGSAYFYGDDPEQLPDHAWYYGNSLVQVRHNPDGFVPVSHPVASKAKNAWGLYDMAGNVWQWMQNAYGEYNALQILSRGDLLPTVRPDRAIRGGSYLDEARFLRSAARRNDGFGGSVGWADTGFRLVRVPE